MQQNPAILAIDDDPTSLKIIEGVLTQEGYQVFSFTDVADAIDAFRSGNYDLVLSDFFMPRMNGDELLRTIRQEDEQIAFVFLTANTDMQVAIDLVKTGADDHITKPIVAEELLFRIEKALREKEQARAIERAEQEKALLDLENRKLVNWRTLYASKDIHQTKQMIHLLSRTINQSGGFLWIEMLRNSLERIDDDHFRIGKDLVDMILTSAESQKAIFDYINFIVQLDSLELDLREVKAAEFFRSIEAFMEKRLGELAGKYEREKVVLRSSEYPTGTVSVDMAYVEKVVHELLCNAVKFSPTGSRIMTFVEPSDENGRDVLKIVVRNKPIETKQTDPDGQPIAGIPYDFSELVFDLFYTIDSFLRELEEEEWGDGTGLYVARKLIQKMNGWITTGNGVDYTGANPSTYVRFAVTIPVSR